MQRFGLAHISAGDLLRAEVAAGTPAGQRAKDFMDRGDLVPDEASPFWRVRCFAWVLTMRRVSACA